ncbi:hypothetical protein B7486_41715 [cyanobacterium TDX16]|nr:hypothetical protein B7486_41715 [cyanobacterium TDX16]
MAVVQNIAAYTFPQIAHLQQEFYLYSQFSRICTNVDFPRCDRAIAEVESRESGDKEDKGDKEAESKLI